MASSIHIENSSASALIHNERLFSIDHAIDSDDRNEFIAYENTASKGREARLDYESFHQKKMPSNATIIKEGLINLEERHTLKDLEPVKATLEKMGYCVTHISVHKDEGHINPDGSKEYNYHAHVMIINYDFEKHRTVRPTHKQMRELQTDVAKALDMQRGLEYINPKSAHPEQIERYQKNPEAFTTEKKTRLKTWDYKKAMELKENATKELTQEIKAKDYSLKEVQSRIVNLEGANAELRKELHAQNREINKTKDLEEKERKITELEAKLKEIEEKNADLSKSLETVRSLRSSDQTKISELRAEVIAKDQAIDQLKEAKPEPINASLIVELQNENKMLKVIKQGLEIELSEAKRPSAAVEVAQGENEASKEIEKQIEAIRIPTISVEGGVDHDHDALMKYRTTIDNQGKKATPQYFENMIEKYSSTVMGVGRFDKKALAEQLSKEKKEDYKTAVAIYNIGFALIKYKDQAKEVVKSVVKSSKSGLESVFNKIVGKSLPEVQKERTEPNLSNSDKIRGFVDQLNKPKSQEIER